MPTTVPSVSAASRRLPLVAFALALVPASLCAQRDLSKVEIRATRAAGSVWMLEGSGGNIGVSIGEGGVLMVDDQFAPLADRIRAKIDEIGGDGIRFVLNTHWHGDHVGGNSAFGKSATIIAHENVRKRLTGEVKTEGRPAKPQPKEALPVVTFEQSVRVHWGGEPIDVIHFPRGHTDGDSVVFFRKSNVVHMGDLFFNGSFPFVDIPSGGDVENYARTVKSLIDRLPADVRLIPGHGKLGSRADLETFHDMLVETTAIIRRAVDAGKSIQEARAAGLPAKWDSWGKAFISTERWIDIVWISLTQNRKDTAAKPQARKKVKPQARKKVKPQAKGKAKKRPARSGPFAPIEDKPGLPRVLLIGDSISIGYTLPTRALLAGKTNVHRAPTNCGPTTRGVEQIETWIGSGRWDVIHFNFGLHDLKYVDEKGKNAPPDRGRQQVPLAAYEKNLEALTKRLAKTGARLVFATTTPVPPGEGKRVAGDAAKYNEAALRVMKRHGVAIDDLFATATARLAEIQRPRDVHFTPDGSKALAEKVAASILEALQPSKTE